MRQMANTRNTLPFSIPHHIRGRHSWYRSSGFSRVTSFVVLRVCFCSSFVSFVFQRSSSLHNILYFICTYVLLDVAQTEEHCIWDHGIPPHLAPLGPTLWQFLKEIFEIFGTLHYLRYDWDIRLGYSRAVYYRWLLYSSTYLSNYVDYTLVDAVLWWRLTEEFMVIDKHRQGNRQQRKALTGKFLLTDTDWRLRYLRPSYLDNFYLSFPWIHMLQLPHVLYHTGATRHTIVHLEDLSICFMRIRKKTIDSTFLKTMSFHQNCEELFLLKVKYLLLNINCACFTNITSISLTNLWLTSFTYTASLC